jgi:FKBP-type peptidyl-prolyl cis-trans isomerase FklB
MQKSFIAAVTILAAGMLLGNALAQNTPAATTQATPSSPAQSSAAPAKAQTSTAKKPATTAKSAAPLTLKTQKEKFSYALGMRMGANLKKQDVPVDSSIMARGLRDGLMGNKSLLTDQEAQDAITAQQKVMQEKQQAVMGKEAEANKKEGEAFLTANKSKEGVVALPDGMEYKILQKGEGPKPTASDTVTVNYRGTLINGTEFDSSYKRGQPVTFPLNGVIKGWTEGLQLMPVGSKWQLFIPSELAYGDRGAGANIAPGSTLIFEVELISIGAKNDKSKEQAK